MVLSVVTFATVSASNYFLSMFRYFLKELHTIASRTLEKNCPLILSLGVRYNNNIGPELRSGGRAVVFAPRYKNG